MFYCAVAINYYVYLIQKNHRRAGCHDLPTQYDVFFNTKMLTPDDLLIRGKVMRCLKLMPLGLGVAIVAAMSMWAVTSVWE